MHEVLLTSGGNSGKRDTGAAFWFKAEGETDAPRCHATTLARPLQTFPAGVAVPPGNGFQPEIPRKCRPAVLGMHNDGAAPLPMSLMLRFA